MNTAKTMTNAWVNRTLPDAFYEEPERVEDGMTEELTIWRISRLLWYHYENRKDMFMSGGVYLFYDQRDGDARVRPDYFIAFGVDAAAIRVNLPNFWLWETGKAPDWVMEVASPSTARNDLERKRELYASLGIAEYWRFDPSGGELYGTPLAGERLVDGRYVEYEGIVGADGSMQAHSKLLGLDFHWNGAGEFDILDPSTGRTIDQRVLEREARLAAESRADSEREARLAAQTHANAERQARQAAEERIRQLEAKLEGQQDG